MVKLKAIFITRNDSLLIYNKSFGEVKHDMDMTGSLLEAITSFGEDIMDEDILNRVGFAGADIIIEQGRKIRAIAMARLDKKTREKEENHLRKQLLRIIKEIERKYAEELEETIVQIGGYSGIDTLIYTNLLRDKMAPITHSEFGSNTVYLQYPESIFFELTPQGKKPYGFYRGYPEFTELKRGVPIEKIDKLVRWMENTGSMISLKDALTRLETEKGEQIFDIFKFLTRRGVFKAYRGEYLDN